MYTRIMTLHVDTFQTRSSPRPSPRHFARAVYRTRVHIVHVFSNAQSPY